ncbi:MAG: Uma2 family endonuclease [Firmicutes bacterium]|nr:Uma2 family endonuclease [Bacillota bacterium]
MSRGLSDSLTRTWDSMPNAGLVSNDPISQRRVTYSDYAALDDGRRYQVLSGILVAEPAPTTLHQQVVANLFHVLRDHIDNHIDRMAGGILLPSPVDVILDPEEQVEVLQPDIVWVRPERSAIVGMAAIFGVPDLVVEVLSPSNAMRDRSEKIPRYRRFGVPHVWILDPEMRLLEEMVLAGPGSYEETLLHRGRETVRPGCFPGLRFELARVWPAL